MNALDSKLTGAYADWKAEINNFNESLKSLNIEYLHDNISKEDYLRRIDEMNNQVITLKSKIDKCLQKY